MVVPEFTGEGALGAFSRSTKQAMWGSSSFHSASDLETARESAVASDVEGGARVWALHWVRRAVAASRATRERGSVHVNCREG